MLKNKLTTCQLQNTHNAFSAISFHYCYFKFLSHAHIWFRVTPDFARVRKSEPFVIVGVQYVMYYKTDVLYITSVTFIFTDIIIKSSTMPLIYLLVLFSYLVNKYDNDDDDDL